jgi:hypothetical protein
VCANGASYIRRRSASNRTAVRLKPAPGTHAGTCFTVRALSRGTSHPPLDARIGKLWGAVSARCEEITGGALVDPERARLGRRREPGHRILDDLNERVILLFRLISVREPEDERARRAALLSAPPHPAHTGRTQLAEVRAEALRARAQPCEQRTD